MSKKRKAPRPVRPVVGDWVRVVVPINGRHGIIDPHTIGVVVGTAGWLQVDFGELRGVKAVPSTSVEVIEVDDQIGIELSDTIIDLVSKLNDEVTRLRAALNDLMVAAPSRLPLHPRMQVFEGMTDALRSELEAAGWIQTQGGAYGPQTWLKAGPNGKGDR